MKIKTEEIRGIYGDAPESFHRAVSDTLGGLNESPAKPRRAVRSVAVIAAAAAVISACAVTANAVFKPFAPVKEGNYGLNINLDVESAADENGLMTLGAAANPPEYVKPTVGYLPEGMYFDEQNGKYRSTLSDETGITILYNRITEKQTFTDYNVTDYDELTVNGNSAVIARTSFPAEENKYTRRFYIYFEDMATFVEAYVTNDIPDDELIKIMEGITVEECSENEYGLSFTQAKKEYEEEKRSEKIQEYIDKISDATRNDRLVPVEVGTKITLGNKTDKYEMAGLIYSVDSIEVLDNIGDLDYNKFDDYHIDFENDIDENGYFLPYERKIYRSGDGVNEPFRSVIGTQTAEHRLIYATLTGTNTTDSDRCFYYQGFRLGRFNEQNGELSDAQTAANEETIRLGTEAAYIDNNNTEEDGFKHGWNFLTMTPGDTQTVHIGFICDSDELDYIYLTNDGGFETFRYDADTSVFGTSGSWNLDGSANHDTLCTKVR